VFEQGLVGIYYKKNLLSDNSELSGERRKKRKKKGERRKKKEGGREGRKLPTTIRK